MLEEYKKMGEKLLKDWKGAGYTFGAGALAAAGKYAAEYGKKALVVAAQYGEPGGEWMAPILMRITKSLDAEGVAYTVEPGARPNAPREDVYRIAAAIGQLGLQDARGAGAHEDADAAGAVARDRGAHALFEAVGPQREQGQAVVAAVEGGQRRGQRVVVHASDLAHPGRQVHGLEGTRLQAAAVLAQRRAVRVEPHTQAGGGGGGRQQQGLHGGALEQGRRIVSDGCPHTRPPGLWRHRRLTATAPGSA